jgi:hypothetical protein
MIFLLLLCLLPISARAMLPSQIVCGAYTLYECIANRAYEKAGEIVAKHKKSYGGEINLYKRACDFAIEKKDAETAKRLSEIIYEKKKGFVERYPKIIIALAAAASGFLGYKYGLRSAQKFIEETP